MCVLKNVPKPAMKFYNVEEFLQIYDLVALNLVSPIIIIYVILLLCFSYLSVT